MGQGVKRTQRDYSLTFKLALVEQIEKASSPTNMPGALWHSGPLHRSGMVA
jgi:hypothetical protein